MPRKKKPKVVETIAPKLEPMPTATVLPKKKAEPKTWPVAPTFPSNIQYYEAEKIEKFRKEYNAFLKKYGELAK